MKTFEVLLTAGASVLVSGVADAKEAIEAAKADVNLGDFNVVDAEVTECTTPRLVESARRHADHVSEAERK